MMANRAGYNPDDKVSRQSKGPDAALAGLLSGVMTRGIVQPLDVFKIRFQLQIESHSSSKAKYHGLRHTFVTMLKEEGVVSFWKGHMAAQYLSAVYMTAQFYGVDLVTRNIYTWMPGMNSSTVSRTAVVSGGGFCGAIMATLISFPFDVVRTRVVAQPTTNWNNPNAIYYKNTRNALYQIVTREGFRGLYKGVLPQLLSMGPTAALQFASYNLFTENWIKWRRERGNANELGYFNKFICGALSGAVSKTLIYPLDTVRKRLQVQGFEAGRSSLGETPQYKGMTNCIATIFRQEGMTAFYKGYVPGMGKALLASGLYFSLFEVFKVMVVKQHS